MIWYLLRRVGGALLVLLALSAIVYALFYLAPGDPAVLVCGKGCDGTRLELVRQKLGLNEPVYEQYWHFLQGIVAGRDYGSGTDVNHCPAPCLGYSFQTDEPVTSLLIDRLPVSASLAMGGVVLGLLLGVGGGLVSALRQGGITDRVLTGATLVGFSTPVFITGLLLIMLFCAALGWLPFPAYVPLAEDPVEWAKNLILPWTGLALIQAALYTRMSRAGMLDTLVEDHVRTFRAYGLRERQVVARHALRGSLIPVITLAAAEAAQIVTQATLTESMYGLPGIGKLTVDAVNTSDLPVIVGVTLVAGLAVVVANIAADALYAAIDPRVKLT
jgi:peptide/nickel transport system permease protein